MGIFDALNTSVAGLQAQSFALQNISGNIANAQTTGYKGVGTSFVDLVPDSTTPNRQVAGSVTAYARATISSQGTVSASTVATYMAINGDGFFSVQNATVTTDNKPVFTGVTDYTRRGDFQVNANGNLVNGAGYYLLGVAVDPKTGNPLGNVPQVLQFQNNFVPAEATSAIQYAANLPTTPLTPASTTALAGSVLAAGDLNPGDFAQNPLVIGTPTFVNASVNGTAASSQLPAAITTSTTLSGTAGSNTLTTGFAAGDTITVDGTTFHFVNTGSVSGTSGNNIDISDSVGTLLSKIGSVTGGAVTAFNAAGTPVNLQMRWAKVDSSTLGSGHQDTWNLFYQNDPAATGTNPGWTNVGTNFTFGANGTLISPTGSAIPVTNVQVSGQSLGTLTINVGSGGLTQYATTGGAATINNITQNGFAAGQLQSVAISNSGLVVGTFSNGQNLDLAS